MKRKLYRHFNLTFIHELNWHVEEQLVHSGLLVRLPVHDTNIVTLVTDLYSDSNYCVILVCCYSVYIHLSAPNTESLQPIDKTRSQRCLCVTCRPSSMFLITPAGLNDLCSIKAKNLTSRSTYEPFRSFQLHLLVCLNGWSWGYVVSTLTLTCFQSHKWAVTLRFQNKSIFNSNWSLKTWNLKLWCTCCLCPLIRPSLKSRTQSSSHFSVTSFFP